jgi:hypothetical protein
LNNVSDSSRRSAGSQPRSSHTVSFTGHRGQVIDRALSRCDHGLQGRPAPGGLSD